MATLTGSSNYKPNERFTVVLEESPGSGTSWKLLPNPAIRVISQRTEDTRAPGDTRLGAPVRRIFELEAVRNGTLRFQLWGPGGQIFETQERTISIDDAGSWQALFFVSAVGLGVWAFLHFGKKSAPARQPALNQNYGYR